ncbi:flagellar biosynthesis protein FlhF [Virgibacillus sp. MSP4-1]|uniref:flagellar biosynthesis protein FlhF n=1 Tax=Virgibacillus sp. MSP4-1 TaxID=2700081 RepID=UPI0003A06DA7|nr:flagellar biosynthesis protein FlhF [Virgibacillus sp. MSP4-1]QHS22264.1 flagellar biosynthesis protein FlhF [Virgibacillus sp. MSP4-1]
MKVKKYTAQTMPEAMKQVRNELGSDAVILNSKIVKPKGIFGIFKKNNIEVIAAIDPNPPLEKKQKPSQQPRHNFSERKPQNNQTDPSRPDKKVSDEVIRELRELRETVTIQQNSAAGSQDYLPTPINKAYQYLINQELNEETVRLIIDPLLEKYYLHNKQVNDQLIFQWLKEELEKHLQPYSNGFKEFSSKVMFFVGPTGVGKTTTIAKVAAKAVVEEKKKVAFLTTDTYRIGAIDQLKTYGKILNVPVEIAYNQDDFQKAKEKFSNFDMILVDTAGRNYKQVEFIKQLEETIDFEQDDEMFLVLSATTKNKELSAVLRQFHQFPIKKLIFTKLDETSEYGPILNIMKEGNAGLAFLSDGQDVPDDIKEGSTEQIISLILGGWNHD